MNYVEIENLIGYKFKDKSLLVQALTHSTSANEKGLVSNERLEYLGDALVDFIVAEKLYLTHPKFNEGKLTSIRKQAVCRDALCEAKNIEKLSKHLKIAGNLSINAKIKADLFEAITAAIYLDSGLEFAKKYVLESLDLDVESLEDKREDYKSKLLEKCAKLKEEVEFRIIEEFGPPHAKTYVCAIFIKGAQFAVAEGTSKKRAEQTASKLAIQHLK